MVETEGPAADAGRAGVSRRTVLAAGLGVLGLGVLAACGAGSGSVIGPDSPQVAAVAAAQPRPGAPQREFALIAQPTEVDLGGVIASSWGYGPAAVGPLVRASVGDRVRVRVDNGLPTSPPTEGDAGTSVHWHGVALRNDMDGVPDVTQPAIRAGGTMLYEFSPPHSGTFWYHSHVGVQRDRALIGPLIIEDPTEPGDYDAEYIVVLDDWLDGINGASPDATLAELRRSGMQMGSMGTDRDPASAVGGDGGDADYPLYLVNGRSPSAPETFTARPGQRVRLRIINAAGDTAFRVALGGHRMLVTHSDAFPVTPTSADAVLLGSGERYDAVVTLGDGVFPLVAVPEGKPSDGGRAIVRTSPSAAAPPVAMRPAQLTGRLISAPDLRAAPSVVLPPRTVDRTHQMVLTADMATYRWMINGRTFDQRRPLPVRQGERVRLEMINQTMMYHPMHLHGHTFVLRDGTRPDGARKDTVNVLPGQTVAVEFDADNPGQWLTHCHLVYHEAAGMMTVVSYET